MNDRKGAVREEARRRGVPLISLAYHLGIPYNRMLYCFKRGLTAEEENAFMKGIREVETKRLNGAEI